MELRFYLDVVFQTTHSREMKMWTFFSFKGFDKPHLLYTDIDLLLLRQLRQYANCNSSIAAADALSCLCILDDSNPWVDGFTLTWRLSWGGTSKDGPTPMEKPPLLRQLALTPILGM